MPLYDNPIKSSCSHIIDFNLRDFFYCMNIKILFNIKHQLYYFENLKNFSTVSQLGHKFGTMGCYKV